MYGNIYERMDDKDATGSVYDDIEDMDFEDMLDYFEDTDPTEFL